MEKVTFKNNFHGTSITLAPKTDDDHYVYLSENQLAKLKRKLCGSMEQVHPRIGEDREVVDYRECECCGHIGDYGSDFETRGDLVGSVCMCQKCYDLD